MPILVGGLGNATPHLQSLRTGRGAHCQERATVATVVMPSGVGKEHGVLRGAGVVAAGTATAAAAAQTQRQVIK
jgi:hypothetical protein